MLENVDAEVVSSPTVQEDGFFLRTVRDLTFEVQIPRAKLEELGKSGHIETTATDQRRHVRFRQLKRCILRCEPTFPTIERPQQLSLALVTNISRKGVGLLYHSQLYPKESFVLRIEGAGLLRLTVARCRKLGPQCYEIGATAIRPIDIKKFAPS
ncbi:hypothetical protein [Bremerella alba]|uniref:PilZ domain-containing protein n=1 Tax=Bremerella alba TaxID=980252 RepID=A0A7V8V6P4_9BACT|nr:hypothetical protein [Bremerella alba]MBA2115954.1 hypothetical protein [Bremerella alba]